MTVGRSSLQAHERGVARYGRLLLATLLAASGLAIGWTLASNLAQRGGPGPQAAAPMATQAAPSATARPTIAPTPTPSAASSPAPGASGILGGGSTGAATHLDPRFGMSGDLLAGSVDTARAEIGMLADDGLGAIRFAVSWRDMEPARATYRGLDKLDAVVTATAARSMQAILVVGGTPGWANGGKSASTPPAHPADYARFIGMLAHRYAGRVAAWEIWNDPDRAASWSPSPSAGAYARLLQAARRAIRSADARATVIAGSIAFDDTAFVQALYAHGAKGAFDVLAVHPSTAQLAPDSDDSSGSLTATLDGFHALLRREDDEDIPVWVTDLGWTVAGRGAVSSDTRIDYLERAVAVVRERPWVGLLTVRSVSTRTDAGYGLSTDGRRSDGWLAYASAVRDTAQ